MSNVWTDELHGRKGRELPKSKEPKIQPISRADLTRIVARTPEVLVQVSRATSTDSKGRVTYPSPRTAEGLQGLAEYLGRVTDKDQDDIEITDDLGLSHIGRAELREEIASWKLPESSNRREVLHIVMGMPKFCSDGKTPTDVAGVERAATATADKLFKNHRYLIAHHRDSDGGHPHSHLLVKMEPKTGGRRLDPRKPDLQRYRETYANELRNNGVAANATSAVQRLSRNRNVPQATAQAYKRRNREKNEHAATHGTVPPPDRHPNRTITNPSKLMKMQAAYMTTLADAIESKGDADLASKTRRFVSAQMSGDNLAAKESAAMRFSEQQHADLHHQDHTHSQ